MKIDDYIIFQNEDFVAINKPAGLLTIPDREGKEPALKGILKEKFGEIFTVHRLDKETSGIVVFAKNERAHKKLSILFEGREIEKFYLGLVIGKPANEKGNIDAGVIEHPVKKGLMAINKKARPNPPRQDRSGGGSSGRGKSASTDYEVLESFRFYSWMQFQIHTGRTHQIRVHMKHFGNPVVCDALYGDGKPVLISTIKKKNYNLSKNEEAERPILSRLALHSWKLKFTLNKKEYNLKAELPKDLKALLQQLRKNTSPPTPVSALRAPSHKGEGKWK
ncbi:MAG: RNA pseudouridine synthase [Bacteroidota bacterium]|nr:RNA pseudouridine synthase [Bacteroidota bacterium]